jgi:hypothetical protein
VAKLARRSLSPETQRADNSIMQFDIRIADGPRLLVGNITRDLTPEEGIEVARQLAEAAYRAVGRALAREALSNGIAAEIDRALGKD